MIIIAYNHVECLDWNWCANVKLLPNSSLNTEHSAQSRARIEKTSRDIFASSNRLLDRCRLQKSPTADYTSKYVKINVVRND